MAKIDSKTDCTLRGIITDDQDRKAARIRDLLGIEVEPATPEPEEAPVTRTRDEWKRFCARVYDEVVLLNEAVLLGDDMERLMETIADEFDVEIRPEEKSLLPNITPGDYTPELMDGMHGAYGWCVRADKSGNRIAQHMKEPDARLYAVAPEIAGAALAFVKLFMDDALGVDVFDARMSLLDALRKAGVKDL